MTMDVNKGLLATCSGESSISSEYLKLKRMYIIVNSQFKLGFSFSLFTHRIV